MSCDICVKIGRGIRTPNINMNGINIRNKLLRWMDLSPINKYHLLSYDESRLYIDNKKPSVSELMSKLPSVQ